MNIDEIIKELESLKRYNITSYNMACEDDEYGYEIDYLRGKIHAIEECIKICLNYTKGN